MDHSQNSTKGTLTVNGNEITDATRTANLDGDGRSPESSYGIYSGTTNLVPNNGFEVNTSSWAIRSAGTTITWITGDKKFGVGAVQITTPGNAILEGIITDYPSRFTVAPNTIYTLSAYVKAPLASVGETIMLSWDEFTSGNSYITSKTAILYTLTGTWTRISFTATTEANAAFVLVSLNTWISAQALTFYADGIQMETNAPLTPYTQMSRGDARIQFPSNLGSATQGWIATRVRLDWDNAEPPSNNPRLWQWQDDQNNRLELIHDGSQWKLRRISGGLTEEAEAVHVVANGDVVTSIGKWTANGPSISFNGNAFNSQVLYDDFNRANGSLGIAHSGQPWVQVPALDMLPGTVIGSIVNHQIVAEDSGQEFTAAYNGIDLGSGKTPVSMRANFSFTTGNAGGNVTLISNRQGLSHVSQITDGSIHIVFTDVNCIAGIFVGGELIILDVFPYKDSLTHDGTVYSASWTVDGNTLYIDIPDGTHQTVTDNRIPSLLGRYLTYENFWLAGQAQTRISGVSAVIVSDTATTGGGHIPTLAASTIDIGSSGGTADWITGEVFWAAAGTGMLTSADAASIEVLGNTTPSLNTFSSESNVTFVWSADNTSIEFSASSGLGEPKR
jgi:hypothetical protein